MRQDFRIPKLPNSNTVLSNSFSCRSSGNSRFARRKCMAFFACSVKCFLAFKKLPDLENITPRYLYLSVILITELFHEQCSLDK